MADVTVVLWKGEDGHYFTADEVVGYGYPPADPRWVASNPGMGRTIAPKLVHTEHKLSEAESILAAQASN